MNEIILQGFFFYHASFSKRNEEFALRQWFDSLHHQRVNEFGRTFILT